MYSNIKAKDIMTSKLITLRPSDDVYLGLHTLLTNKISGAPVVDEDGTYLGVFNEKSCMNVVIADQYHGMSNTDVGSFMFRNVQTISPDTTLIEIGMLFLNEPLRRLPVLDAGRLVGQVSRRDVLHAVEKTRKASNQKVKAKPAVTVPYYSAIIDPFENPPQI